MAKRVLVTGGAGFIGAHVADELLRHGYEVRALDILDPQVHGEGANRPSYLAPEVELHIGDIREAADVRRALDGVDAVIHLAAAVGVGQSMYEIARYTSTNTLGTAVLMEALVERPVGSLVVASSMSIYGEGLYRDRRGELVADAARPLDQIRRGSWDPVDADGLPLTPVATPESKTPSLSSVYALNKYDQERLALLVGQAYNLPTVALRFFNVYGPHQALSNPYTGVLAIFGSRLLNDRPPAIFEDGEQRRDFVHVRDVATACRLALETPAAAGNVFNIGSGESVSISELAVELSRIVGKPHITPEISGRFRVGDIRHCFADISAARRTLGFAPAVPMDAGLLELAEWLAGQQAEDRVAEAGAELERRGLTV